MVNSRKIGFFGIALVMLGKLGGYARATPVACFDDPTYKQANFLLGKYEVYAKTEKIADVVFDQEAKGCAIRETWISTEASSPGFVAVITYLRDSEIWEYFAVMEDGSVYSLKGLFPGPGHFRIEEKHPRSAGALVRRFDAVVQPDGSLIDFATTSSDGRTWKPEHERHFRKRN